MSAQPEGGRAASLAGRLRRLLSPGPQTEQAGGGAEPRPGATGEGRYGVLWNPPDELSALQQIYNTSNPDAFEEGGRLDRDRLRPYYDSGSRVLDLGCGIGRVARHVAPECAELVAVDVSQRMLDMAAEKMAGLGNVRYVLCHDVVFPDVASESVDLAYSLLVLQHLEREDAFLLLEELRRVVKPSGTVVLTFPNLLADIYLRGFVDYAHARAATEPARARLYTPQEVAAILPAAGFDAELDAATEIWVVAHPA